MSEASTPLDPEFIALLACPACDERPPVELTPDNQYLRCTRCRRKYPIMEGGIPKMLVDEAIID
ncbi:MAG: hypothetical protein D6820_14595, partial [Lentisphaerae bacterium]